MAWWVYKCSSGANPYNAGGDWREFFDVRTAGGQAARWGLLSVVPALQQLHADDMVFAYQTDRNELVGLVRGGPDRRRRGSLRGGRGVRGAGPAAQGRERSTRGDPGLPARPKGNALPNRGVGRSTPTGGVTVGRRGCLLSRGHSSGSPRRRTSHWRMVMPHRPSAVQSSRASASLALPYRVAGRPPRAARHPSLSPTRWPLVQLSRGPGGHPILRAPDAGDGRLAPPLRLFLDGCGWRPVCAA